MPKTHAATVHADLVRTWNDTGTDYPRDALVHELLEEQARRRPDKVALSAEGGADLTYAALVERVERLAGWLGEGGVGAGDIVAVALGRSVEGYVALLAVLRAGAVYLPIDLNFPVDRVRAILADAGCRHAVSTEQHLHLLPPTVRAFDVAKVPADCAPAPRVSSLTALSPAYVMYTSGSTGAPKGVVIPHRAIVRLVRGSDLIGYRPDDVVCGTVNLTFDLSALELFGALLNGARLIAPTPETLLSPAALEALLLAEGVTVMWLGAALFHEMAARRPGMFSTLRCLVAGGDALNPNAVRRVLEKGRPGELVDGYGPTENGVLCTAFVIDDLPPEAESVPIGRPISNCTAYVVGEDGDLADVGEEGELWVGGDGVALGYLNQPELTAERFVLDRFSAASADGELSADGERRLYRTGDMARWRPDGVIEFLGRRDRQVKLGGFRVELREIEIVLAAHPDVKEAVVAVGDAAGDSDQAVRLLRGWVLADDGIDRRALPMRLRSYLRDRLPVFMVPQEIEVVASVPMSASGKVDRAALLAGGFVRPSLAREDEPRGPTEEAVAAAWRRVLGIASVGRMDDFFGLGGQSLQAAQVAAELGGRLDLHPRYGRYLIRTLLDNSTVASYAATIDALASGFDIQIAEAAVDFARETELPESLRFDAPHGRNPLDPHRVLLTGATGFQGVFLLDRLVASGVPEVWCLIRAADVEHAARRLAGRMRRYGLDYDKVRDHVVPVPGDVSLPRLGLDGDGFDRLATSIDVIVHCGSLINFAYPYARMRPTNVGGVRTLLDLAATHHLKPFHHVSTIIALSGFGTADDRYVMEDRPLAYPERISLGYAESKWVAERLVSQAAARGLPVSIYRPYEITGTRDRRIWNTDTLMCAWFRTIAETGLAPDVELPLDFVPVDYTAEAIVHILRSQSPDGRVYNLANPRDARLGLLVDRLRHLGYPVREIPYGAWVDMVTGLTRDDPHHPMTPFMPMFNEGAADTSITVKEMYFAGTFPEFSSTNTLLATADAGLDLPPVDADLIDLYLGYFIESGFLTPPTPDTPDTDRAMTQTSEMTHTSEEAIRTMVKRLQPDVTAHVRENALYAVTLAGGLEIDHLRRLIAGELHAQPAEIAAFTHLAERLPGDAGRLFGEVAAAITAARPVLLDAAAALGLAEDGRDCQPPAGAETFADFICWLGLTAPAGVAAAVLRADLMLWCAMCGELVHALGRGKVPCPDAVLRYIKVYEQASPPLITLCANVITAAVVGGEDPAGISRAVQRVGSVLRAYWSSVAVP